MKMLGIICTVLFCCGAGMLVSLSIRERVRHTEQLAMLLEEIRVRMQYQQLPIDEMLSLFAVHPNYQEFQFLQHTQAALSADEPPMQIWCEEVMRDSAVVPAAKDILCDLGNILGTTDLDGQLSALSVHRMQLQRLSDEMRENCRKRGTLSCQLGGLAGAMLAVLLI